MVMPTMQRGTEQHLVFVSYSHKDESIVTPIVLLIRVVAASTFQDRDSIEPGQKWREVLFTTIDLANLIIVFWSQNSANSKEVRKEWTQAINSRKKVVPVLLDSTPLHPALAEYQYLDLRILSLAGVATTQHEDGRREEVEVLKNKLADMDVADATERLLTFIFMNYCPFTIKFPEGYDAQAQSEAPFRGYLSEVIVQLEDGSQRQLSFIDPARLEQSLSSNVESGRAYYAEPGLSSYPRSPPRQSRRRCNDSGKMDTLPHPDMRILRPRSKRLSVACRTVDFRRLAS
jgi:hypothetical protein